jgi:mono/diheme cytochrome c family protein
LPRDRTRGACAGSWAGSGLPRIVSALFAVALATSAAATDGAALYASKCKACHGPIGEGAKMARKPITGTEENKKAILQGYGKMSR